MKWRDSVLAALRRFAARNGTRKVDRQQFLREELSQISAEVQSRGQTPSQTISRVLQQLRDEGLVAFVGSGSYLLTDQPIDIETGDLPDEAIDVALQRRLLRFGCVKAGNDHAIVQIRRGQSRIRALTVISYQSTCAVCDVSDEKLLIASHIVGWSESPEHRGNLRNVICLCRFHDALFEIGYWSLGDDYHVLRRENGASATVNAVLQLIRAF